jgi:regulator of RNase E activity RraA
MPPGRQPKLFGFAVTARCVAADFGAVLHSMDLLTKDTVLVIGAGAYCEAAMIGDILGGYARSNGASGVVCDGAVRDAGRFGRWSDFSVFARAICSRGPSSAQRGAVNVPIMVGGRMVSPGDLLIGDDDGVVALSPDEISGLINAAEEKLLKERMWEAAFSLGQSVSSVFNLSRA